MTWVFEEARSEVYCWSRRIRHLADMLDDVGSRSVNGVVVS